jgi:hypothetical protein
MRELSIQELAFVSGGANTANNGGAIGGNGGNIIIRSSNAHNNNTSITTGDIITAGKTGSFHLVLPFGL